MNLKNLLTFFTLLVAIGCSTTPSIETRHKVIPSKKNEHEKLSKTTSHNSTVSATVSASATGSLTKDVAISTPPKAETPILPPVVVPKTEPFAFDLNNNEKQHSPVSYEYDSQKIGVILPVTGKNANLAQRALNAIRLGLGLEEKNPKFQLVIYDSQSNQDLAAQGVEKLLRDDHVVAILGGLSSKEAQSISNKAEYFQVPFISFSQKSGLTDDKEYVFRNSITPEMQVARLLSYAFNTLKAKRFAIMYPNDAYGVEFSNKFWSLTLAGGGEVVAAQPYDPKDTNLDVYIKKLVGTYYTTARPEEYQARLKEISDKKKKQKTQDALPKKNSREHETQENILTPVVDFDVLFIPDGSRALGQIMAFMKNNDVTQMTYLGTNLWNTPDLHRRVGGNNASSVYFVDANITPDEVTGSSFHANYTDKFLEEPSLAEAQIFEASKILKDLIGTSAISRSTLAERLSTLGRRQGAYSEIRMNNNREIERSLNVFGLAEGTIQKTE